MASLCLAAASARAATITVTGTGDTIAVDGVVTLREAITSINNGANLNLDVVAVGAYGTNDTINFSISGAGVHTIKPASSLPAITKAVLIDGYTQPGASANTLAVGDNALLLIEIDGTNIAILLNIQGPNGGSTIRGLVLNHLNSSGVNIGSSANNTITGNFIGVDPTGTTASAGNIDGVGCGNSSGTVIGGTTPAARNVMSVGASVVDFVTCTNGLVQGNYIGINAAGTGALPAGGGIFLNLNSTGNTIGGTAAGAGNVIGNFSVVGVHVDAGSSSTTVQGNLIGTNATGTAGVTTGGVAGVVVSSFDAFSLFTANVTVGGTAAGAGNLISGVPGGHGIRTGGSVTGILIQGNRIGTDITGTTAIPNAGCGINLDLLAQFGSVPAASTIGGTAAGAGNLIAFNGAGVCIQSSNTGWAILGNSIHSNGGLGIDLNNDGVTANDACDADTGANNLQNYPVLTTASSSGGNTNIQGTLNSVANTTYRIEFFSNSSCDASGFGEGQTFLGSTNVNTDGSCNATFNVNLPVTVSPQARLTATATDPAGNTSEFSACTSLQAQYHTVAPCRVADTRGATGAYGGPALAANANRTFVIGGQCGISPTAQAVSFNFTITLPTALGDLRTFPGGGTLPLVSTMNWRPGQTRANNAIVPLGSSGDLVVHVDQGSGTVHFIIDVNGYFE